MRGIIILIFTLLFSSTSGACTRAVYLGTDGVVITGRSMDWSEDMGSNLWKFPRGMQRDGAAGPNILEELTARVVPLVQPRLQNLRRQEH